RAHRGLVRGRAKMDGDDPAPGAILARARHRLVGVEAFSDEVDNAPGRSRVGRKPRGGRGLRLGGHQRNREITETHRLLYTGRAAANGGVERPRWAQGYSQLVCPYSTARPQASTPVTNCSNAPSSLVSVMIGRIVGGLIHKAGAADGGEEAMARILLTLFTAVPVAALAAPAAGQSAADLYRGKRITLGVRPSPRAGHDLHLPMGARHP